MMHKEGIGVPADLATARRYYVELAQEETKDLDIYRTAQLLIEQHGDEASIHAAMRADELMDRGDMDGRAVWLRIIDAINDLQAMQPAGSVH